MFFKVISLFISNTFGLDYDSVYLNKRIGLDHFSKSLLAPYSEIVKLVPGGHPCVKKKPQAITTIQILNFVNIKY